MSDKNNRYAIKGFIVGALLSIIIYITIFLAIYLDNIMSCGC